MRKPVIGVMGGADVNRHVKQTAFQLGALIARKGWVLLNGGRDCGVMAASARGAKQAGGTVIGILPDRDARGASDDLDVAVITGLGDARNVINVLSSDVVIACPGGAGTLSEIALALKNKRPVITLQFDLGGAFDPFRRTGLLTCADSPQDAITQAEKLLSRTRKPQTRAHGIAPSRPDTSH